MSGTEIFSYEEFCCKTTQLSEKNKLYPQNENSLDSLAYNLSYNYYLSIWVNHSFLKLCCIFVFTRKKVSKRSCTLTKVIMRIISLHLGTSNKNLETIKIFSKEIRIWKKQQLFFKIFQRNSAF